MKSRVRTNGSKVMMLCLIALLAACGEEGAKDTVAAQPEKSEAVQVVSSAVIELPIGVGDRDRGRELYEVCATCHGEQGQGIREMNAPALANMSGWSLKGQLVKFKGGLRGGLENDDFGQQMAQMVETLEDGQAILDVVAYIDSFGPVTVARTLDGDLKKGAKYYNMICGACHGPGGVGSETMKTPALVGVDDWYLERQFQNFKTKVRGYHPQDRTGRQMGLMAGALPDDQTLKDILVFLHAEQTKATEE